MSPRRLAALATAFLVVVVLVVALVTRDDERFDLVVSVTSTSGNAVSDDDMNRTIDVVRTRLLTADHSQPSITRSGNTLKIEVDEPFDDEQLLNARGVFEVRPHLGIIAAGAADQSPFTDPTDGASRLRLGEPVITKNEVTSAETESVDGVDWTRITFTQKGTEAWQALTAVQACKPDTDITRSSAFVIDGKVVQVAGVATDVQCNVGITGGVTQLSATDEATAKRLAAWIGSDELPAGIDLSMGPAATVAQA